MLRQVQHRGASKKIGMMAAMLAFPLIVSACSPAADGSGQKSSADPAEPPASGVIAPGTYSNAPAEGDGEGWRVTLARGERSNAASIAHCAPECAVPVSVPVRIGMGGLMAEFQAPDGRLIPLAIRPHGDGIEVAADWGEGLESHKLMRSVAP